MRFFRLMVIGVVLLVLAGSILGMACAGAKGAQGPEGETGAQGPQGVQGIQGVKGDTGEQGPQGIQGPQGTPGIGVEWVGEWDSAVSYAKYDAVGYQGSSYISKQPNNTNNLPTDVSWWDLWVQKGNAGEQGLQGVQGIQGEKGDTGDQGQQGVQGVQGVQGEPGPNMIVAMGVVTFEGSLQDGYNVTSCLWYGAGNEYVIELTGMSFDPFDYVVTVTPMYSNAQGTYAISAAYPGRLAVYMLDSQSQHVQGAFSFVVLDPDLA